MSDEALERYYRSQGRFRLIDTGDASAGNGAGDLVAVRAQINRDWSRLRHLSGPAS